MAAEIGARINRLPISEGGAFKAGQLLVGFDCSLQQAQLQKAQAELEGAEQTFKANQRMAELNSNMYMAVGQGITISFAKIPAGTYKFNCTPHLAMGMKGLITVDD